MLILRGELREVEKQGTDLLNRQVKAYTKRGCYDNSSGPYDQSKDSDALNLSVQTKLTDLKTSHLQTGSGIYN